MCVWPPTRQGGVAVCEPCELPLRYPRCDIQSERGWPSYGWRRVGLPNGRWFIGREKMEGRKYYGGVWYRFYSKSYIK